MEKLWAQVSYEIPDAMTDEVSEFLLELSPDGVVTENLMLDTFSLESVEESPIKTVTAFFEADLHLADKMEKVRSFLEKAGCSYPGFSYKEPSIRYIKEEDWSSSWKSHFKPSRIGKRIVVKPTWEEYDRGPGDIVIELDPGMAFGTGTHATTRLCMEVLEKIFFREGPYGVLAGEKPVQVLDVGTGSGILSITAAKLGAQRVIAIDIDQQAVAVAEENVTLNGAENSVKVSDMPLELVEGTHDIVVANILAEELVKMAPALINKTTRGGFLILSGILAEKEDFVLHGFPAADIKLVEITREAEWSCLAYRRNP